MTGVWKTLKLLIGPDRFEPIKAVNRLDWLVVERSAKLGGVGGVLVAIRHWSMFC